MKPDLQFDFIVDRERNTITVRREFAARRELVWDCYTRSELLDRWFAPEHFTTRTKSMDFREGGHWHYAMVSPDGQAYWSRTDYQTITPGDSFTSLDGFSDEDGAVNPAMPRSKWHVSFSDKDGHTLVTTIIEYGSAEDLQKVIEMGMQEGMTSTLSRLDELLLTVSAKRNKP